MLDTYDFEGDVWLCHSFEGQCHDITAFVCKIIHPILFVFVLCFRSLFREETSLKNRWLLQDPNL